LINKEGVLGYIVSSMYFKSIASKNLRSYLQNRRLISRIVDFGDLQIFNKRQTYTCLTFISKKWKDHLEYALIEDIEGLADPRFTEVYYDTLNPKKWRLLSKKDQENISKIENMDMKLGIVTDISTGVATLSDSIYFVDSSRMEDGFYIKSHEGKDYLIEPQITKEIFKVSDFLSQEQLEKNTRRIIFPYTNSKPRSLYSEECLSVKYPRTYEYLLAVKEKLGKRDKGKRSYEAWYAYGRTQGLNGLGEKLLTPTFSDKPRFLLCTKRDALFCNGYAISPRNLGQKRIDSDLEVSFTEQNLRVLAKILNSYVMDYYIRKTSYVIEGGYYCYQKQFIESFSIPRLSEEEVSNILTENNPKKIDDFLLNKYRLEL